MIVLKISKIENNLPQRTRNTAERDVALFWQYIFFNCFLSLFSSHLFRKSSSRCYIFHLSSPHQVAFLKRTIKKYGKTDWICIFFFILMSYETGSGDFYDPTTLLRFLAAAYHKNWNICYLLLDFITRNLPPKRPAGGSFILLAL